MKYQITQSISIDERHILFEFVRAEGPGGQNVNKVSSACDLRFDLAGAHAAGEIPDAVTDRFVTLAGRRLNQDGVMIIKAQRFRSQERNRDDALERLFELIREAAIPPIPRRPTKPTRASKERRLESKKGRQSVKEGRKRPGRDD
jgi:ribosome-associated protein